MQTAGSDAPPEGRRRGRSRLRPRAAWLAALAAIALASAYTVDRVRGLWFFGDDWQFLLERRLTQDPVGALLDPHNEHWSTVPVLIFRTVFAAVGLEHYPVYALLPIAAHAVLCVLVFALLTRDGIRPWVAVAATAVLALVGVGAENLVWDFQVGMILSAVFPLLAMWLEGSQLPRRTWWVWLAAVLGLASSGTAIGMLAWLGGYVLLTTGLRRALTLLAPPGVVYLGWWLGWGRHAMVDETTTPVADIPGLVWHGLSGVWSPMTGVEALGGVLLVLLLVAALVVRRPARAWALALSAMAAVVVMFALFARSRGWMSPDLMLSSRYLYFGALLTIPALALTLDAAAERLPGPDWLGGALAGIVAVPLLWHGAQGIDEQADIRRSQVAGTAARTVAAAGLLETGEPLLGTRVEPTWSPNLTTDALARDDVRDRLPDVPVTPQALLSARAALQVSATPADPGLTPGRVRIVGTSSERDSEGCLTGAGSVRSHLEVPTSSQGRQVQLTLNGYDRALVRLRVDGRTSAPVLFILGDQTPTWLATVAPEGALLIDLPAGPGFRVCA